jgi:hypothetical protein
MRYLALDIVLSRVRARVEYRLSGQTGGMTRLLVLIALVAAFGAAPAAAAPGTTHATLRLLATDPPALRGLGFKPHERVRVVVYAGKTTVTRTTATLAGRFTVRITGLGANTCAGFSVIATGSMGSRASFKRAPGMCPAP